MGEHPGGGVVFWPVVMRSLLILALVFQPLLAWGAVRASTDAPEPPVAVGQACCPLCDAGSPEACGCCCVQSPAVPDGPTNPRGPAPDRAHGPLLAWLAAPVGVVGRGGGLSPVRASVRAPALHPIAGQRVQPFVCVWTT